MPNVAGEIFGDVGGEIDADAPPANSRLVEFAEDPTPDPA
jgi:hypothetical protein